MAKYCVNCAEALGPGAKFCGSCGTAVEPDPVNQAVAPAPVPALPAVHGLSSGRRYPALRAIAVILKIFAVFSAAGGLVSYSATPSGRDMFGQPVARGPMDLLIVVGGLCTGLALWAGAEIIHVVIDIEENTRRSLESGK